MNNKSSSRVSAGAWSSEDEGGSYNGGKRKRRQKLHIKGQKFVIHPNDLRATRSELCGAQRSASDSTTIPLDDRNSEKEIRARILENLPQLMGKSFKLFTTGKHGHIFCPCSQNPQNPCQDPAHAETPVKEWNAKNIKKLARGHKVVYIHCQENRNEEAVLLNTEHISHSSVASTSTQSNVADVHVHVPVRGELLPKLAMKRKSLNDEEISRLVTKVSLDDNKDTLQLPVTDGKKEEKIKGEEEREEEEEEEEEEDEDEDEDEYEEEELESGNQGLLGNVNVYRRQPMATPLNSMFPDSAYHTGSTTTICTMDKTRRNEMVPFVSHGTVTEYTEIPLNQEPIRTIDEIAPTEGSVEGGYNFLITLNTTLVAFMGLLQVMFGDIPADSVTLTGDKDQVKGKVPKSPTPGVVEVKVLNAFSGETITINSVEFEYIEKDKYKKERRTKRRNYLKEELRTSDDCLEMISLVFETMKDMKDSDSKGSKSSNENEKTRALAHLRMIVETAAKINAMKFFTIIFNTSVGRNVFKSFKNEEILLEEVARENGHEELACFLEQRHSMYRDDENDSDDEVDWASLAKAVKHFQRNNAERETNRSTTSSEDTYDYSGDVEDCQSFLSLNNEELFDVQETNYLEYCQDAPETNTLEGPNSWSKRSLPHLKYSLVGRDKECEEIIANLASDQFRIGVIYESLGIGKTSVAVEVGHKLLSKGWNVSYHICSIIEPTSEILTPYTNLYQALDSANHLKYDNINEPFPVEGSNPTLLILDQVENVNEAEPKALQTFVDVALKVTCIKLLLVSRKEISFTDDVAFHYKLKPLSEESAIQLLQSFSQISSHHDLGLIAKGCGCNPLALMIIRALIDNGMPEKDIASKISSPENFWKKLFHSVEKCHVLTETETKGDQKDSLKLPLSSLVEMNATVQTQIFLESWIEETSHLDKKQITCYEKAFDPRYCHCRLCMKSDGKKNLKSVLSSVSSVEEQEETSSDDCLIDLQTVMPKDFERENTKANEAASRACTNRQSTSLNSCISVDEKHLTAIPVPEKVSLEKKTKAEAELKVSPFRKSAKRSSRRRHGLVITAAVIAVIAVVAVLFVYFFILRQKTGKNAAPQATNAICTGNQFWMVHANATISCEDCGSCSPGQGLSHECGKPISSNTIVTCVPCESGISFSSKYDTSSCTPCGFPCLEDQVVLQNCTPTTNVKCQCHSKDRYYDDLGSCMSCSKCCGDNKDVVENECEQKLGAASNKICSFLGSVNRCDTKTTVSSIQETTTTVLNTATPVPFTLTRARDAATTLTASSHQSTLTQGAQSIPHLSKTKQDLDNSANIIVPVAISTGLLLLIIAACLTYFLFSRGRCSYLRRQHDTEMAIQYSPNGSQTWVVMNSEGVSCQTLTNINKVKLGGITSAESKEPLLSKEAPITLCFSQENTAKVSKPLSSLQEDENALEGICVRLDTAVPGCGHYREVAQYYGLNHYEIVSVLEKYHGGPTRALIETLAATHTELTVEEFATVVEDKTKRKDVSQLLREQFMSKPLSSLQEDEDALEGICVRLDTAVPGCGNYREVAQYYE